MKERLIVFKFNGRNDNLGDKLITRCLLNELDKYGKVCFWGQTPDFVQRETLRTRHIITRMFWAWLARRPIINVGPPGARLASSGRYDAQCLREKVVESIFSFFGARKAIIGLSVSPNMDLSDMRQYEYLGVRDRLSLEALHQQGVSVASYCPDLALLCPPVHFDLCSTNSAKKCKAVFSFRESIPDNEYCESQRTYLMSHLDQLLGLAEKHAEGADFYYQVNEDRQFNQMLYEKSAEQWDVKFAHSPTLDNLFDYFEDVAYAFSNRLHVLLVAAISGAMPIAIVSKEHHKVRELYSSLGWESFLFDLEKPETWAEKLSLIAQQRKELAESIREDIERSANLIRQCIAEMVTREKNLPQTSASALDSQ
jgi:hypothetical protein